MNYGKIPGLNKPVSRMAQGTIMCNTGNQDKTNELLDASFAGGVTMYDTAYIYGGGENERSVGNWVNSRGIRDEIVMIAKGGHHRGDEKRVNRPAVREEVATSLDRFGFDYVDLYILHRDDPQKPVGEIVDFMSELVDEGRIHAWGGSNWEWERIRDAVAYANATGRTGPACSSPNFSLAIQVQPVWAECVGIAGPAEADARAWYSKTDYPLVAWSSVARGFFSGKLTRENYEQDEIIEPCSRQAYCYPVNFERLDRVREMAPKKGLTVPQLALAYVMGYPLNIFALVGPRTPAEFRENLAVLDVKLSEDERRWLETGE
jgi:aryl-alcohol dehydrogenase-like predicted oxidoreductase